MKQAKAQAARNLVDKMDGKIPPWHENEVKPPVVRSCYNNSVCILHNYCAQRDLSTPRYFTPLAPGAGGRTTICRCGPFVATGAGSSRKVARGNAARGVLTQLEARYGVSIP